MCTIFAHTARAMNILYKIDKIYHRFDTLPYSKTHQIKTANKDIGRQVPWPKIGIQDHQNLTTE